jgi:dolichol-phosphate mannosyltransferase
MRQLYYYTNKAILKSLQSNPFTRCLLKLYPRLPLLIRYMLIGGLGVVVDFFVLLLLTELVGVYYIYSAIIGFLISDIFCYVLQKEFTFKNKSKGHLALYSSFITVSIGGIFIDIALLYALTEFIGIFYMLSKLISITASFIWDYFMAGLIFKKRL